MSIKKQQPDKSVSRRATHVRQGSNSDFLKQINTMPHGLIVVKAPEPYSWWVREAVEKQLVCGHEIAGMCLPSVRFLWSMHSGGAHGPDKLSLATLGGTSANPVPRMFCNVSSRRNYNFSSDEGLDTVVPMIERASGGCVTFSQPSDLLSPERFIDAMHEIRSAAKKSSTYVVMFIIPSDQQEMPDIREFCDDYFDVEACEPNPNAHYAFSIDSARLTDMYGFGFGKMICNCHVFDAGYESDFEPFVAKSLINRYIWRLHASGKSLSAIAELIFVHRSTVRRRLNQMPRVYPLDFDEDEEERYFDEIYFGGPVRRGDDESIDFFKSFVRQSQR